MIDPRTIVPLDLETILDSVRRPCVASPTTRTRRGFGAELAARIMEEAFDDLDAPVERVAALTSRSLHARRNGRGVPVRGRRDRRVERLLR